MSDDGIKQPAVHNDLSGVVHGPVVQASSIGQIVLHANKARPPIPRQLPSPPRWFANRERELTDLDRWLDEDDGRPLLVVISGLGGVGKTSLALHWLHRVRDRFPDGQLYVDLGAFSGNQPASPNEVLEWFLLALGTPAGKIPTDSPQRVALFRSLVADRAIAILLDNALSAAQVRSLLTVSRRSAVVVTSRWRLAGLRMDGARFLYTDPLTVPESVTLLQDMIGEERTAAQRTEAEELARLCGGLPIALSLVGARLSNRPHRSLSREVGELRRDRLATLSLDDEPSVTVVFDLSYDNLSSEQSRLYRLCSLHPALPFGVEVAAAMTATPLHDTETTLESLAERGLLNEVYDGRFHYHDLLLEHARWHADQEHDVVARSAVTERMVEWYLDTVVAADLLLRPTRRRIGPRYRQRSHESSSFRTRQEAIGWLTDERRNIVHMVRIAEENQWDPLVWEFCEAMWSYYLHARNYDDWLDIHNRGIPAARRCGDLIAEAQLHCQLGQSFMNLRRYEDSISETTQALRLAKQHNDKHIEATALSTLAQVARGQGDFESALRHLHQAREIREIVGTARALALCRQWIGETLGDLGRYEEAVGELSAAAEALSELDQSQYARALTCLGSIHLRWEHFTDAQEVLNTALTISTQLGSPFYRAATQVVLGDLARALGDTVTARRHYADAHGVYAASGDPRAEDLANRLAGGT